MFDWVLNVPLQWKHHKQFPSDVLHSNEKGKYVLANHYSFYWNNCMAWNKDTDKNEEDPYIRVCSCKVRIHVQWQALWKFAPVPRTCGREFHYDNQLS